MKYLVLLFMLLSNSALAEVPLPCPVYQDPNLLNKIAVRVWISDTWKGTKFVTYPSPDAFYDDFHTLAVIGYIDKACWMKIKDQVP